MKLVPRVPSPPRKLSGWEEVALLAAVTKYGRPRDRTLLVTALHTGLRAEELCDLTPTDVKLAARSGHLTVYGKRNEYREVPLDGTAREALGAWLAPLPRGASRRSPRGRWTYILATYAALAEIADVSPHDLRHRFAQIMEHDSLDTTLIYVGGTKQDLQQTVREIAWA